ncbi:MAG: DUF2784 domain-containing protein [Proteobacteria bacterium]|nr:DUF2784 domain-containing protein [Desulfobulbaceae bacterium]MBU4153425.1 DUF2784 domain-containing protein [Pseudomonadota bacterium]MDP2107038.1 DUF2784 domain-containing protein [Desulfobulbaceae bacterium]
MTYLILADSVLVLHLLFIGFVIFGGFLVLRTPRIALLHIPAACWGAYIELSGKICPLTPLEVEFRRAAGDSGYSESFVEHYLIPIIYPPGLTRGIQFWLAGLVIVINALIYGISLYRKRSRRVASKNHRPLNKHRSSDAPNH